MITEQQKQDFANEGYLVVRGVLDVGADAEPFKQAYTGYLDSLADIYMRETRPGLRATYPARPFGERFAISLGCSGGSILQHLDPSLSVMYAGYRWRSDLPSAQRPELLRLMCSERLLDLIEQVVGPEITSSPIYHMNLKLPRLYRQLAAKAAAVTEQESPRINPLWRFQVGDNASWHTDAAFGFSDALNSRIINAWIPMTSSTMRNGCLMVSPGSHRLKPEREITSRSIVEKATALPAEPGDVILLDNNLVHTALSNMTTDQIRWAFNFRYLPTGEPTGRPFLPSFVARSRSAPERELRDAALWGRMWRAALELVSRNPVNPNLGQVPGEAEKITARWNAATRNYNDWLDIGTTIEM
jgi:ectoine hydroxylase-related dioxygenase (phytanoyl-CoA dioxygenase family)